jgi:SAM-dependent MidA family methyltransferase
MDIKEQIAQHIQLHGDMCFADYMNFALYGPGGYYNSGLQKFGKGGDFVTAPELTPLFGYALANQCQQVLQGLSSPVILEFGAGSGQLAVDLLQGLERLDSLPTQYLILEVSGALKARQQVLLQAKIPHLYERIHWLSTLPEYPVAGIMIANEVLDAMPVHRFINTEQG